MNRITSGKTGRWICCILCIALAAAVFSACEAQQARQEDDSLEIVTTIFPLYDWTKNILGDNPANAGLSLLMDSGVDPHSFQPTPKDMVRIAGCDLFICVGGESDEWIRDFMEGAMDSERTRVLRLMDALTDTVREEELVPGMEGEEDEDEAFDEHVWLSPENARIACEAIEEAIAAEDPEHAAVYAANLEAYEKRIADLDRAYRQAAQSAPVRTLLFGDRFPFRYLTEEYGLDYYAAFPGCSAETEASFDTIRFLAEKTDELDLPCVMTIDGSDRAIAEAIVQNTASKDQKILTLDSMQSVTSEEIEGGVSWLSIMRENLAVLREALRCDDD